MLLLRKYLDRFCNRYLYDHYRYNHSIPPRHCIYKTAQLISLVSQPIFCVNSSDILAISISNHEDHRRIVSFGCILYCKLLVETVIKVLHFMCTES